jgi:hypothetical protein
MVRWEGTTKVQRREAGRRAVLARWKKEKAKKKDGEVARRPNP